MGRKLRQADKRLYERRGEQGRSNASNGAARLRIEAALKAVATRQVNALKGQERLP